MLRLLRLTASSDQLAVMERTAVVMVSTFLNSACHTAISPILPTFAEQFGIGAAGAGLTISIFAIARLLLNVPAGIAADKYGTQQQLPCLLGLWIEVAGPPNLLRLIWLL